jgi:hypothetical protein
VGVAEAERAELPVIVRDARALNEEIERVQSSLEDIARNYVTRLHAELASIQRRVVEAAESRRPPKKIGEDFTEMIELARSLQVKPHKGRRKDMKRVDELIGELQGIVDKW